MTIELTDSTKLSSSADTLDVQSDTNAALRFITCGSVDDGKSTLIGRLLVDSKSVLQDHLAGVTRQGEADLALLTDGLSAEREQGITIDVAYRYFSTESRKFIIGDAPGHEQYTRNMVTAASQADAAVVLVDATKLDWESPDLTLLAQTRRHSLLLQLLRVPSIVFAINKLDAVANPPLAFAHIRGALQAFAQQAEIRSAGILPISALKGWNVVDAGLHQPGWCDYVGPTLLQILESLPVTPRETDLPLAFPVQWVEKFASSNDTSQGRRIFWGRVATGQLVPGERVTLLPSGQTAVVAQVLDHARLPKLVAAGQSAGVILDRELDVSRGDWIVATATSSADESVGASVSAWRTSRDINTTIAWLDDEPLVAGRVYWALHGHRWIKAKVKRVVERLNVHTLAVEASTQLEANAIGHVELALQEPIPAAPFTQSRGLGSLILVDASSQKTSGAVLVR